MKKTTGSFASLLFTLFLLNLSACSPAKLSGVANSDPATQTSSNPNSGSGSLPGTESSAGGSGGIESTPEQQPQAPEAPKMVPQAMPYPTPQSPNDSVPEASPSMPKVSQSEQQVPQTNQLNNTNPSPQPNASSAPEEKVSTSQILDSCFAPQEPCDEKIIAFLDSSRISLDIAIYSITHSGIADAIVRALNRGVQVRMIVDREQARIPTSQVDELIRAQVPLKFGTGLGAMHNKFTILDKTFLETGSYNYTRQATSRNAENQLYLRDPKVIARFQAGFEKLWKTGSSE